MIVATENPQLIRTNEPHVFSSRVARTTCIDDKIKDRVANMNFKKNASL